MKKLLFSALALLVAGLPFTNATAENINIFAFQDYSWEIVDIDREVGDDKDYDRIANNSATIGFEAHMDTGVPGLMVGFRCEQFTFHNRLTSSGLCNRSSKLSLVHDTMGEVMFGHWLMPFTEMLVYPVEEFGLGGGSVTSIMGNLGYGGTFYSGGSYPLQRSALNKVDGASINYDGRLSLGFNRNQEEIIQYSWPRVHENYNPSQIFPQGFQFRFAMTSGVNNESDVANGLPVVDGNPNSNYMSYEIDPRIYSTAIGWRHQLMNGGRVWFGAGYERHNDWTARQLNVADIGGLVGGLGIACEESDDDAWRIGGYYVHDWGTGMMTKVSAMWEELDYDTDNCVNADGEQVMHLWSDVERDSWMISGHHNFGNGFAFKFSYLQADDMECPNNMCGGNTATPLADGGVISDKDTDADAINLGIVYTLPNNNTNVRLTYTTVDNSVNSNYNLGALGADYIDVRPGDDVDMWSIGLFHYFD